jgi:hypothetical protein
MWVRIAAHFPVWYEPELLALYRVHGNSSTGRSIRTGENLRDLRRAVSIIRSYLPGNEADAVAELALQRWARFALREHVPELLRMGDPEAALAQVREALKCSRAPNVLYRLLPVLPQLLSFYFRSRTQHIVTLSGKRSP